MWRGVGYVQALRCSFNPAVRTSSLMVVKAIENNGGGGIGEAGHEPGGDLHLHEVSAMCQAWLAGLVQRVRANIERQIGPRLAAKDHSTAWPPGQDNDCCNHPAQRRRVAKAASHCEATCR